MHAFKFWLVLLFGAAEIHAEAPKDPKALVKAEPVKTALVKAEPAASAKASTQAKKEEPAPAKESSTDYFEGIAAFLQKQGYVLIKDRKVLDKIEHHAADMILPEKDCIEFLAIRGYTVSKPKPPTQ